jgi:hypothetical protein
MNGMMRDGGMGGGQSGHMTTCPLCGGSGQVSPEVAAEAEQMMPKPDPAAALAAAMSGKGGGRMGGHGGHGG